MSRVSSLIAALPIAGIVLLGGAGTALAATPTTGPTAQLAPSAITHGGGSVLADCTSPAGCPRGGDSEPGNEAPEMGPRHAGHHG
jgi:hypothetical protein